MTEERILQAMIAVWDVAHQVESERGFPMKEALSLLADKLDLEPQYGDMLRWRLGL